MDCSGVTSSSRLESLRRQLENPGEDQRRHEADREKADNDYDDPGGRVEDRQQRARHLHEQPGADQIQSGRADNISPFQFGKERGFSLMARRGGGTCNFNFWQSAAKRGSSL